jgi:hypothetical protein
VIPVAVAYQTAFPMPGTPQFKQIDGDIVPGKSKVVRKGIAFRTARQRMIASVELHRDQERMDFNGITCTSINLGLDVDFDSTLPMFEAGVGSGNRINGCADIGEFFEEEIA